MPDPIDVARLRELLAKSAGYNAVMLHRDDLVALLDEREALRAALKEIEWMVDPRDRSDEPRWCPACDHYEAVGHTRNGHAEGCSIDAALARTGETT